LCSDPAGMYGALRTKVKKLKVKVKPKAIAVMVPRDED